MAKNDPHWIEHMHMKEGAFGKYASKNHESMGKAIVQGMKSKNIVTRHRANLAHTLINLPRKGGK